MSIFNAEQYWKDKPRKKWVVSLTSTKGTGRRKIQRHHTLYVSAPDSQAAIRTAKENTFLTGRLSGSCRLATPLDLGCKSSEEVQQQIQELRQAVLAKQKRLAA